MFCARSRPTNKGNREQKPITKKLAEFHNQFVLLTMMEPMHYASCQATLIEKLSNHNQNFCLSAWWQIIWFWCTLEWKQNTVTAEQNNKYWYKLQYRLRETYHFPIVRVFGIGTVIATTPKQKKDPDNRWPIVVLLLFACSPETINLDDPKVSWRSS